MFFSEDYTRTLKTHKRLNLDFSITKKNDTIHVIQEVMMSIQLVSNVAQCCCGLQGRKAVLQLANIYKKTSFNIYFRETEKMRERKLFQIY